MKITVQNVAAVTPTIREMVCQQVEDSDAVLNNLSHHILFAAYSGTGEIVAHTSDNQPIEIFWDNQLVGVASYSEQNPSTVKLEHLFFDLSADNIIKEKLLKESAAALKECDKYTEVL